MSATADDVLKSRELSAEEMETWRRRATAMEGDLKERLRAELDASRGAEAKVTETWRAVLRLAKVRPPARRPRLSTPPPAALLTPAPPPLPSPPLPPPRARARR